MSDASLYNHVISKTNPLGLSYIPYDRPLVEFVDALVDLAKKNGSKDSVKSEKDWETITYIFKGFETLYPQEHTEFMGHMKKWRAMSNRLGVAREGEAMLQHKFNLPQKVYDMIKAVFPLQVWDKKFVNSFAKRFAQVRGSEKL